MLYRFDLWFWSGSCREVIDRGPSLMSRMTFSPGWHPVPSVFYAGSRRLLLVSFFPGNKQHLYFNYMYPHNDLASIDDPARYSSRMCRITGVSRNETRGGHVNGSLVKGLGARHDLFIAAHSLDKITSVRSSGAFLKRN